MALSTRMQELETLKKKLTGAFADDKMYTQLSELKQGIDVLDAILTGENISQYGRPQQQAALRALWLIEPKLAGALDMPDIQLTPKETFFCVMEHYGISDDKKIDLFCCTEQALRSTKSRLSKKINLKTIL